MMKNKLHKYKEEEIEVINIIEEFNHFQKLIDNGEDRCTTFNEEPDFELQQYYSKRKELYSQLLIALLELQSTFVKTNNQSIDFFQLLSPLSELQSNLIEANNPNPKKPSSSKQNVQLHKSRKSQS